MSSLQHQSEATEQEREHAFASFSYHSNINSILQNNKISINDVMSYIEKELECDYPIKEHFHIKNNCNSEKFDKTRLEIETYLISCLEDENVMKFIAIRNWKNDVARNISIAVINSFKNRYDYKRWTEQTGKGAFLNLRRIQMNLVLFLLLL